MPHKHTRKATADGSPLAHLQSRPAWSLGAWPSPAHALLSLAGATAGPSPGPPPGGAPPMAAGPADAPAAGSDSAVSPGELLAVAASAMTVSAWPTLPDGVALPSSPRACRPTAREP